jgi:predicted nucleic acid-binding protein
VSGYFLDTSAFAKLYHQEPGTDFVERIVGAPGSAVVSRLSLIEIESVFAIKVRTGELDLAGQELARRRLRADISQRRIRVSPPIKDYHYWEARQLLIRHGTAMSLRTLDAVQLAIALDLLRAGVISVLVASDQRLCRVAEVSGCVAIDPCNPGVFRW